MNLSNTFNALLLLSHTNLLTFDILTWPASLRQMRPRESLCLRQLSALKEVLHVPLNA